jgi:hypothetical protein
VGDELGCSSGPLGESLQRQGLVRLTKLSFNLEVVKVPLDGDTFWPRKGKLGGAMTWGLPVGHWGAIGELLHRQGWLDKPTFVRKGLSAFG